MDYRPVEIKIFVGRFYKLANMSVGYSLWQYYLESFYYFCSDKIKNITHNVLMYKVGKKSLNNQAQLGFFLFSGLRKPVEVSFTAYGLFSFGGLHLLKGVGQKQNFIHCLSCAPRCLLLSVLILLTMLVHAQDKTGECLYLLSYNIRHGKGMDECVELKRIAHFIIEESPDVVALQEVDSCCERTDFHDQLAELSQLTGFYPVFGAAIPLQGGKYGVGILSREKPLSVSNHPLPGGEPRTLLVTEFASFVMASTHLALEEENRLLSVPLISQVARQYAKPFFVAGDWNDEPQSELLKMLEKEFTFHSDTTFHTFPSNNPKSCIDYIAAYKPAPRKVITMERCVFRMDFSDHCGIGVKVILGER